jgi:hypothetical protein
MMPWLVIKRVYSSYEFPSVQRLQALLRLFMPLLRNT